ncbi:spe-10 [Pristionchus pacificus]|uniref:Palmitoyltransferase n=1 Tax=Pristionchus pacificus TaxID=54126 RepID=A0A2A6C6E8_PRIPA|nr:spe-10 [Pristionchus pacificus]|eukprot:PDM73700.1 spe-10 [Pristionchus pacificus]
MSWYSVIYTKARHFRSQSPVLGTLLQWSFYVCVLIELLLYGGSSFVYFSITTQIIESDIQASIYLVVYGLLSFMMVWAYARVISSSPNRVPREYEFDEATDAKLRAVTPFNPQGRPMMDQCNETQVAAQRRIMDEFAAARGITLVEVDQHSRLRYCYECRVLKPDRTHHCSSCGFCAVRFDHHCPYLNSCVAAHNYKFFVLFLMYLVTWMIWNVVGGLQAIIVYFCTGYDRLDMIIPLCCLWVLQTASSIWPLGELLRYHWLLISLNETTCEQAKIPNIRGDPKANYDVGRWKNIEIVFGWGLWLFPVRTTTTDGLHHPINYVEPAADAAQFRVTGTAESDPTRSPTATTPLP